MEWSPIQFVLFCVAYMAVFGFIADTVNKLLQRRLEIKSEEK